MKARRPKPAGSIWAVVPVKTIAFAKARLAGVLSASARRRLLVTMLEDVLALLLDEPAVDRVLVVTADIEIHALAEHRGAKALHEGRATGLNPAMRLGIAYAAGQGARGVLLLPADVPLATAAEIGQITAHSQEGPGAVIVPSRDGEGTNALFFSPPGALDPSFGAGSFARHCRQAVARGLELRILRLSGLGVDIDEAADLATLLRSRRGSGRYSFLDLASRETKPVGNVPMGASRS
jgi:2-phospho-L-lactate/phosphoenolpyruvate guanylyltransferase